MQHPLFCIVSPRMYRLIHIHWKPFSSLGGICIYWTACIENLSLHPWRECLIHSGVNDYMSIFHAWLSSKKRTTKNNKNKFLNLTQGSFI